MSYSSCQSDLDTLKTKMKCYVNPSFPFEVDSKVCVVLKGVYICEIISCKYVMVF